MDAYKAIVTKRDTRAYIDKEIPEDVLRRVLQAGRMAGSSKNRQPFRFVVVRDRDHMADLARCGDFSEPLGPAKAAIAVCLEEPALEFDAGRAAQNIMIAAWNEGLASCPVRIHHEDCGRQVLGLPPDWRIAIVIALGYPDPEVPMSHNRPRKEWEEYVRWERW
jgi:nitroreductase